MDTLETPEQRQQRLEAEVQQLEYTLYPALQRDFRRLEATSELALAKNDAWFGGINGLAGGLIGLAGSPYFLLPAAIAAVAVGFSLHHLNKGLQLAKEANAGPIIHDAEWEGTLAEEPALAR